MIAVQCIRMIWEKANRTPRGAEIRRRYMHPVRITDDVFCDTRGNAFVQFVYYYQDADGKVISEAEMLSKNLSESRMIFTCRTAKERFLHNANECIQSAVSKRKGIWAEKIEDIVIPGVEIFGLDEECEEYEVFWHQMDRYFYFPVRKGINVNCGRKNSHIKGRDIKCEKAFVLRSGEAGTLSFNYRYSHGAQHYEQYNVYILNCSGIGSNSFTKAEYTKKYDETAYLF